MLFDALGLFSNAQLIESTEASTNIVDFGAPGTPIRAAAALSRDLGKGQLIPVRIQVVTAFDTCTSVKVAWQMDDDVAFGSATTVLETEAIAVATLISGYVFNITHVPLLSTERYGRFNYTVAGSSNVAGTITAGIVFGNHTNY
jgi:hypothetical protein